MKYVYGKKMKTLKDRLTTGFASLIIVANSAGMSLPFLLTQKAAAAGETVNITNVTELRNAIENQDDDQVWNIQAGNYGLTPFASITVEGQTGWFFPITADNITINGIGNPTLYGASYAPNGNWATQNLVSVFGDNVTINGLTLMPKVQPNKTVEVLGSNFTLRNTVFTPNTLVDDTIYDNITDAGTRGWAKQWGGSLYFSHAGNHTVENLTINNGGVSFRYSPSGTNLILTDVQVVNTTNDNSINSYRYSTGFNNPGNSVSGAIQVIYHVNSSLNNLGSVLASLQDSDIVELDSDVTTSQQITLNKAVTINGNNHTINAAFAKTGNDNNSVIGVQSDNITINNLTVDSQNGTDLHGINVFESDNVTLNNITAINNRTGVVVNGSTATINGITTSGNIWHGINVDKPGAMLTVQGTVSHTELIHILVDNRAIGQVNDVDNQYDIVSFGPSDIYTIDNTAPEAPTNLHRVLADSTIIPCGATIPRQALTPTWTLSTSDDVAYYEYSSFNKNGVPGLVQKNIGNTDHYNTGGWVPPQDGTGFKFAIRAVDHAGNKSAWVECGVSYDSVAPDTPVVSLQASPSGDIILDGGMTNSYGVVASWTVGPDDAGYEYRYFNSIPGDTYNAPTYYTTQPTVPTQSGVFNRGEGLHHLQVRAVDAAGNWSGWSDVFNVTYDATAPEITNVVLNDASVNIARDANCGPTDFNLVSGKINLSATITDNLSGVKSARYKIRKVTDGGCTQAAIYNSSQVNMNNQSGDLWVTLAGTELDTELVPADGNYTIQITLTDNTGNETTKYIDITIDNTAPGMPSITAPGARTWHKSTPIVNSWTAAADDNGIATYQVAYHYDDGHSFGGSTCPGEVIDGMTVSGCRNTSSLSRSHSPATSEQGGVTIWVRAIDNAGNKGPWSKSVHYYYDHEAPVTDINVSPVVDGVFTVSGDASDNLALNRVYVQLVSREANIRCGGTTLNLIPEGDNASWSKTYDIATLMSVSVTPVACPEGEYAAHVSVVDMAGNTSSAGWTDNFMVSAPAVLPAAITQPSVDNEAFGFPSTVVLSAHDEGAAGNNVQWAVRAGTCAMNTNTLFGNVDGHSDSSAWVDGHFSANVDGLEPGNYCFVFNTGNNRLTRTFKVVDPQGVSTDQPSQTDGNNNGNNNNQSNNNRGGQGGDESNTNTTQGVLGASDVNDLTNTGSPVNIFAVIAAATLGAAIWIVRRKSAAN